MKKIIFRFFTLLIKFRKITHKIFISFVSYIDFNKNKYYYFYIKKNINIHIIFLYLLAINKFLLHIT